MDLDATVPHGVIARDEFRAQFRGQGDIETIRYRVAKL